MVRASVKFRAVSRDAIESTESIIVADKSIWNHGHPSLYYRVSIPVSVERATSRCLEIWIDSWTRVCRKVTRFPVKSVAEDARNLSVGGSRSNATRYPIDLAHPASLFLSARLSISLCLFTPSSRPLSLVHTQPPYSVLPVSGGRHPGNDAKNSDPDRRCDQHDQHGDVDRFRAHRHLHPG